MLIRDHLRDRPPTAPLPPVRTAHQQSRAVRKAGSAVGKWLLAGAGRTKRGFEFFRRPALWRGRLRATQRYARG